MPQLTIQESLKLAKEAVEAYQRSETRSEVEEVMVRYGRNGIGYRKLCRILFSKMPIEKALRSSSKR